MLLEVYIDLVVLGFSNVNKDIGQFQFQFMLILVFCFRIEFVFFRVEMSVWPKKTVVFVGTKINGSILLFPWKNINLTFFSHSLFTLLK